jgi:hypothetical protein
MGLWGSRVGTAARALALLAAGGAGASCGVPAPPPDASGLGTLLVSWSFADGRSCVEAGTPAVRIRLGRPDGEAASIIYGCASGLGLAVPAPPVRPGRWELTVEARGATGVVLYRAEARVDLEPDDGGVDTVVPVLLLFL